jgi:hypothetical protein
MAVTQFSHLAVAQNHIDHQLDSGVSFQEDQGLSNNLIVVARYYINLQLLKIMSIINLIISIGSKMASVFH